MTAKVGDSVLQRLSEGGIKRVFGYPGDGINGLMGAMGCAADRFDYIRVRHEEMAAFMVCAHAKFTGEVGVCIATSGPGAIHLLNGLCDAKLDHMPVLAIVGQQARAALGSDYQQEVDLHTRYSYVASYVETVVVPSQARHVIDSALCIAGGERTMTCVIPLTTYRNWAPWKGRRVRTGVSMPVWAIPAHHRGPGQGQGQGLYVSDGEERSGSPWRDHAKRQTGIGRTVFRWQGRRIEIGIGMNIPHSRAC